MQGIVYAGIYNSNGLVASYTKNIMFNSIAENLVSMIDIYVDHKRAFFACPKTLNCSCQCLVKSELLFIAFCCDNFENHISFLFLDKLYDDYNDLMNNSIVDKSMVEETIRKNMNYYSTSKDFPIRKLNANIDEITHLLHDNIHIAAKRGENLEHDLQMADKLSETSKIFKQNVKKVRCDIIKENLSVTFILVLCIIILFFGLGILLYEYFFY